MHLHSMKMYLFLLRKTPEYFECSGEEKKKERKKSHVRLLH